MDASVGVVMKKLKDLGLEENTLVIFTRYCASGTVHSCCALDVHFVSGINA
jgi:hypothetical protein